MEALPCPWLPCPWLPCPWLPYRRCASLPLAALNGSLTMPLVTMPLVTVQALRIFTIGGIKWKPSWIVGKCSCLPYHAPSHTMPSRCLPYHVIVRGTPLWMQTEHGLVKLARGVSAFRHSPEQAFRHLWTSSVDVCLFVCCLCLLSWFVCCLFVSTFVCLFFTHSLELVKILAAMFRIHHWVI